MYRVISCVVRRGCLSWPVHSLAKTLLAFALFHFVLQGQTCLFSRYLLISYSCIPIPYDKNYFFFILVLILDGHVSLHRIFQLQLLQHCSFGHRLGLPRNKDHSVLFEIASKYCISDSFVDGYSISSNGFFPTVVDIIVI